VTDSDLLSDAMAQLYSSDLDEFTQRRGALAASARAAGQASAAKQIAGLRKPTRSAWVVNQLLRAEPGAASRLAAMGADLRAAESSADGARIRELSAARRQLIQALVRQAFAVSGQHAPSAALREEVTATLTAALADPQVAEQMRAGSLVRAARWDGFGAAAASTLTPVPVAAEGHRSPAVQAMPAPARPAPGAPSAPGAPGARHAQHPAAAAADRAAAREAAERERRLAAIAAAEQAVAEADRAAEAAASAELEQESAVQQLEEQVAEARRRLSEASRQARRTSIARRQARQALDRIR
jgi:hypothetical protein